MSYILARQDRLCREIICHMPSFYDLHGFDLSKIDLYLEQLSEIEKVIIRLRVSEFPMVVTEICNKVYMERTQTRRYLYQAYKLIERFISNNQIDRVMFNI